MSHPNWREGLPLLVTSRVVLREMRRSDAASLWRVSRSPEVARYSWPGPATAEVFEAFITRAWRDRAEGKYACFAAVPSEHADPAGIFELRSLQPNFFRAELGLLVDPPLFGNGVFEDAMRLICGFAFTTVGVRRIEMRVSSTHARCNAALEQLGAKKEATLRAAFPQGSRFEDQYLWSVVSGLDRLAAP
jgi:RimJ/RimL family protein N-acetyltransferase